MSLLPFASNVLGGGLSFAGYVQCLTRNKARAVVGAFGAVRVAIGVAFAVAPARLAKSSDATPNATLMTRSFAVREVVIGTGGLLAAGRIDARPAARTWAGLGALTDAGDLAAAVTAVQGGDASARLPALVAAAGLVAELWALRQLSRHGSGRGRPPLAQDA